MNLMLPQLQAAAEVIESVSRTENVLEVTYMTQPQEAFSLVVRIRYRKTGSAASPFTSTYFYCVSPRGVVEECQKLYPGKALYGYLGTLIPFDLNAPNVKVI